MKLGFSCHKAVIILVSIAAQLCSVYGYDTIKETRWPDGDVPIVYNLGSSPVYVDGRTPNEVADIARRIWNQYLGRIQLVGREGPTGPSDANNGENNIFFASSLRGQSFGAGVAAVTLSYERAGVKEVDIVLNSGMTWNSYRGTLKLPILEISRMLSHEFGHLLGLAHPDEAGQNVVALMNSKANDNVEIPTYDDQFGAALLYGPGTFSPKPKVTMDLHPATVTEGDPVKLTVMTQNAEGAVFAWYKDDARIPGNNSTSLYIERTKLEDEGIYRFYIFSPLGSTASSSVKLTVERGYPPAIERVPKAVSYVEGADVVLAPVFSKNPISYQWYKNGEPLAGQTGSTLSLPNITFEDEGMYSVSATNRIGTTAAPPFPLTVERRPLANVVLRASVQVDFGEPFGMAVNENRNEPGVEYQWFKNGTVVPNAEGTTLSFPEASEDDLGEYALVARNSSGTAISRRCLVTEKPPAFPEGRMWLGMYQFGDVVYFPYALPSRIERYDLASGTWLAPITFTRQITALYVSDGFLYVAFGRSLYRYSLSGGEETLLFAVDVSISALTRIDNWFVIFGAAHDFATEVRVVSQQGAIVTSVADREMDLEGLVVLKDKRKILIPIKGNWPYELWIYEIGADGSLTSDYSHLLSSFSLSRRLSLSADGGYLLDLNGTLSRVDDLVPIRHFRPCHDLAISQGDGAIGVIGRRLVVYNQDFAETGEISLKNYAARLVVRNGMAHVFSYQPTSDSNPICEKIPLESGSVTPRAQAAVLDGTSRTFDVESAELDPVSGDVLLFAPLDRQVYRWSPSTRAFAKGYGLQGMPSIFSVSPEGNLTLGYENDRVTQISRDTGVEKEVLWSPGEIVDLWSTKDFVLINENYSYPWTGLTVGLNGEIRDQAMWGLTTKHSAWASKSGRVMRIGTDSYQVVKRTFFEADGRFGSESQSDLAGVQNALPPVRLNEDESLVVFGSGFLRRTSDLSLVAKLPEKPLDAAWAGGRLYTMSVLKREIVVKRWGGSDYTEDREVRLPGNPKRLLSLPSGELLVVQQEGRWARFTILNQDLETVFSSFGSNLQDTRTVNISTRARVGSGDNIAIAGFVVQGVGVQKFLIRAAGPKLKDLKVPVFLDDPTLGLYNSSQVQVDFNNDWMSVATSTLRLQQSFKSTGAFPFDIESKDSALLVDLPAGIYTAMVYGQRGGEGIGLVEVYAVDPRSSDCRLVNISTRARVGRGDDVLIGGFVVEGATSRKMLIRAAGPALIKQKVAGVLVNPRIRVYSGQTVIAENDDWDGSEAMTAVFDKVGAFRFDSGSKESALVLDLAPGGYTVIVEGSDGGSGIALVEIYEVPGS